MRGIARISPNACVWQACPNSPERGTGMYTLYYSPGRASLAIHWMLIELGVPFEARLVDFAINAQKSPDYLRLNPEGMVPTLVVNGEARTESAALALLLAERHPEGGLEIPPGATDRSD